MVSEVNESEIKRDITNAYLKIEQCHESKALLAIAINKELDTARELKTLMDEDEKRVVAGKRPRYDKKSMIENIERTQSNIEMFKKTMSGEDASIIKLKYIITTLDEDLKRPKELLIDMRKQPGFRDLDR